MALKMVLVLEVLVIGSEGLQMSLNFGLCEISTAGKRLQLT